MYGGFPLWPLRRCACFAEAMAVVLRYDGKCLLLDDRNSGFFLVRKGVVEISIIHTNSPCLPRFDGVRIDTKSALFPQVYICFSFSLPKTRTFNMLARGSALRGGASHAAGSRLSRLPLMRRTVKGGNRWRDGDVSRRGRVGGR